MEGPRGSTPGPAFLSPTDARGSWPFATAEVHWISGEVQQDASMTGYSPGDEDQAVAESGQAQGEGRLVFTVLCFPGQKAE